MEPSFVTPENMSMPASCSSASSRKHWGSACGVADCASSGCQNLLHCRDRGRARNRRGHARAGGDLADYQAYQ